MKIVNYWDKWNGNIDCTFSNRIWDKKNLNMLVDIATKKLINSGVQRKEIISFIISNNVSFPVMLIACLKIGCNPLLLHSAITRHELNHLCNVLPIKWICHDFHNELSRLEEIKDEFKQLISITDNLTIYLKKINNEESIKNLFDEGVILHNTSGTGGIPKICIRSQQDAIAEAINYTSTIKEYDNIRIRITTPLNHAFAYGFGLMSSLVTDSSMVFDTIFNPKKILEKEAYSTSDILMLVPPMINALLHLKQMNPDYKLPKTIFYAGAQCNNQLKEAFESLFNSTLYTIYGTTETGAIATNWNNKQKFKGVGKPLNNVKIKIVNKNYYTDFQINERVKREVGDIYIKSTSMMHQYIDQEKINKNNYFPTGDIGIIEPDSSLHLFGRTKDVINIHGIKIDPAEIENLLIKHDAVLDAVVYSGLSPTGDEIILSTISLKSNLSAKDIKDYCRQNLSSYKIPTKFYFVSQIPRNPSGKVIKSSLQGYKK